jgi:hypothetical protein
MQLVILSLDSLWLVGWVCFKNYTISKRISVLQFLRNDVDKELSFQKKLKTRKKFTMKTIIQKLKFNHKFSKM